MPDLHPVGSFVGVSTFDFDFEVDDEVVLPSGGKGTVVTLGVMSHGICYQVYDGNEILWFKEDMLTMVQK